MKEYFSNSLPGAFDVIGPVLEAIESIESVIGGSIGGGGGGGGAPLICGDGGGGGKGRFCIDDTVGAARRGPF